MRFVFNIFNHNERGRQSLIDPMNCIARMLEDLGHQVDWFDEGLVAAPEVVNIVFEGFNHIQECYFKDLKEAGGKLVIVCTEEPTVGGFNYNAVGHMSRRVRPFKIIAPYADCIWYLVPGSDWYKQFAPAHFVDLGYSPRLERRADVEVKYDVGFFGSLTSRRGKVLRECVYRGLKVHLSPYVDSEQRDLHASMCKVILQVKAFKKMHLLSASRCSTALHLGRPVLAEMHEKSGNWGNIVSFTEIENIPGTAYLMAKQWDREWESQMERFKRVLPAEIALAPAVDLLMRSIESRKAA